MINYIQELEINLPFHAVIKAHFCHVRITCAHEKMISLILRMTPEVRHGKGLYADEKAEHQLYRISHTRF